MILGHFGLALAAKRASKAGSAGTYTAAAQLADLVWPALLLAGVEQVAVEPHRMAASSFDFVHYPWTHSLAMLLVWGAVFAGLHYAWKRDARTALVIFLLVPSHWVLDFFVHSPDLPLWPGGPKVGLGGWSSLPLTIALELLVLVPCVVIYLRTTKAKDRIGSWGLYAYLAFLIAVYFGALFGPPPADVHKAAIGALSMWLLVPWAAWFDRHRV